MNKLLVLILVVIGLSLTNCSKDTDLLRLGSEESKSNLDIMNIVKSDAFIRYVEKIYKPIQLSDIRYYNINGMLRNSDVKYIGSDNEIIATTYIQVDPKSEIIDLFTPDLNLHYQFFINSGTDFSHYKVVNPAYLLYAYIMAEFASQRLYDYTGEYLGVTDDELQAILDDPYGGYQCYNMANGAMNLTIIAYGYNGHNDCADAFRHCYWNLSLSEKIGTVRTEVFTTAHESEVPSSLQKERIMDLHNNELGRWLFDENDFSLTDPTELYAVMANLALHALWEDESGLMLSDPLDSNSDLVDTDASCQVPDIVH